MGPLVMDRKNTLMPAAETSVTNIAVRTKAPAMTAICDHGVLRQRVAIRPCAWAAMNMIDHTSSSSRAMEASILILLVSILNNAPNHDRNGC